MKEKILDYSGVEQLWLKIKQLTEKQSEVVPADESITVTDNKVAVNVSKSEGNTLSLKQDGLFAGRPVLSKLTFGSNQQYVYDGTRDIIVPVYDGTYDNN